MIIIAGPCQLESEAHGIESAEFIKEIMNDYDVNFYFKTSFDKANRTSLSSPRGAGIKALKDTFIHLHNNDIKTLTDIHEAWQAFSLENCCDVLQIPAMLSRQTDLITAAAKTNSIVNIKKGQFMSPHDMKKAKEKAGKSKHPIWLTERGTSFGYNNLVVDYRSLIIMKEENPDAKILFDCTHSCQLPSANGVSSGGDRKFALPLAKAATAVGVDGLFLETHHNPDKAPSDGPNMIPFADLWSFMDQIMETKNE